MAPVIIPLFLSIPRFLGLAGRVRAFKTLLPQWKRRQIGNAEQFLAVGRLRQHGIGSFWILHVR